MRRRRRRRRQSIEDTSLRNADEKKVLGTWSRSVTRFWNNGVPKRFQNLPKNSHSS